MDRTGDWLLALLGLSESMGPSAAEIRASPWQTSCQVVGMVTFLEKLLYTVTCAVTCVLEDLKFIVKAITIDHSAIQC